MGRGTLLIAEDVPLESLWAAGRLDLLRRLGMRVLVLDGVLKALTRDPGQPGPAPDTDPGDAAIGAFIQAHQPPFAVEETVAGALARERRRAGEPPKTNAGEAAMADFMTADSGIDRYLRSGDPFLVLSERLRGLHLFGEPSNLHLLSTAGLLRGLERAGVIPSADEVLRDMLHPAGDPRSRPER